MKELQEFLAKKRGRASELARKLDVTPGAVYDWFAVGQVPAKHVIKVAEFTGIPRSRLRPDIYPPSAAKMSGARSPARASE